MFALLLSLAFEVTIAILVSIVLYEIFISNFVNNTLKNIRERKNKIRSCERIAQLKLISNNIKEIESFINDNAVFISDETNKKLISHIEYLKAERLVGEYDSSKKRIDGDIISKKIVDEQEVSNIKEKFRRIINK